MGKLPGFMFYPGDWMKDPELRRCSKAAKGVWMDMLAMMFECADRGVFSTGGVPWTDQEVAAAIGGDMAENLTCLEELLRKGVAHRNGSGAIFSARMVRDQQTRITERDKKRNQRSVPVVVPPVVPSMSVNESESVSVPVVEVAFELDSLNGEQWFERVMEFWPHKDRSYRAQNEFFQEFERIVATKKWPRVEAVTWLIEQLKPIAEVIHTEYPQAKWKLYPLSRVLKQYENGPESFKNFELQPKAGRSFAGEY